MTVASSDIHNITVGIMGKQKLKPVISSIIAITQGEGA